MTNLLPYYHNALTVVDRSLRQSPDTRFKTYFCEIKRFSHKLRLYNMKCGVNSDIWVIKTVSLLDCQASFETVLLVISKSMLI